MHIVCTSDLHGYLPDVPPCDLLLVAGDVCPCWDHNVHFQWDWLDTTFRRWLEAAPARHIVGTWGNHDRVAQERPWIGDDLPWTCLVDDRTVVDGVTIFGSPWSPTFHDWAWMAEERELVEKYEAIQATDEIVLSHCPPLGVRDVVDGPHLGSMALTLRLGVTAPALTVCGHIHSGYGVELVGDDCWVVNAAHLTETYLPNNPPIGLTYFRESRTVVPYAFLDSVPS